MSLEQWMLLAIYVLTNIAATFSKADPATRWWRAGVTAMVYLAAGWSIGK